jgi:hypothetical protein
MRTVAAGITAAEIVAALNPAHTIVVKNELLSFAVPDLQTNANLTLTVPQSYVMNAEETHVFAAFRRAAGTTHCVVFAPGTAANWALTQTATAVQTATSPCTMRPGVVNLAGTLYIYRAGISEAEIQISRSELTGTTNAPTLSWGNWGPTFGAALTNTSDLVRRIESISITDNGVIVVMGNHDYVNGLSTLNYSWIAADGNTHYALNAIVQAPLTDTYSTWYADAHWATHTCAVYNATTETIWVYTPMDADGRTGMFGIRNGIETPIMPVLPVDNESTAAIFRASSVTVMNSRYYLAGRMTREMTDGSTVAFDCYLTSADGEHWSIGERSFYLQSGNAAGTLVQIADSDTGTHVVYYGGNLYFTSATATPLQDAESSTQFATLGDVESWQVQQITGGADSFSMSLLRGNAELSSDPLVKPGAVAYLQTGQGATVADFGVYGLDKPSGSHGRAGASPVSLSGRDIAGKRLADWRLQFDAVRHGRHEFVSTLTTPDGLIIKTPDGQGYTFISTGLKINGLNDPFIAYLDAHYDGDGLMKLQVTPTVANDYHLSSVGGLVGAADDGTGTAYLVPKANAWTDHTQTVARLRSLALPAANQDDPSALDSGFNLATRVNNLWESAGGTARTAAVTATYATDSAPAIVAATKYDIAIRTMGKRAQVFVKAHDLAAATCAAAAGYTLRSQANFSWQLQKMPEGKAYTGIAAGTDVFVDTSAFAHAMYDDVELALTSAEDYLGGAESDYVAGSAAAYTTQIAGTYTVSNAGASDTITLVTGTIGHFSAGQRLRVVMNFSAHGDRYGVVESAVGTTITLTYNIVSGANQGSDTGSATVWLASATEWATASSDSGERTIDGAVVPNNTGAAKAALMLYGAGVVVTNDNTALEYDYWKSDGVTHWKLGTDYDVTNPIAVPTAWRFLFSHNALATYRVSDSYNLATAGYMIVDDEVIRYIESSYTQFGQIIGDTPNVTAYMTLSPTYYTIMAKQAAPAGTVYNAWIDSHAVGEGFDSALVLVGMLVEMTAREAPEQGFRMPGVITDPPRYYVVSKSGTGATAAIVLGTYDAAFGTLSTATPQVPAGEYEVAICSGRGAFGTVKTGHEPTAPVLYYPCNTSTGAPASILISRLEYYSGKSQTLEDAIKTICAWAGQHSVTVRNATATPAADVTRAITTTPYSVTLRESCANFVLDLTAHIPATTNGLRIVFRNYYRLHLWQTATAGVVRVGLETTSEDVDLSGDYRWLEWAEIPLTEFDISTATSQNCHIRLTVQDQYIHVDICGQHAWTFNLDSFVEGTTIDYRADTDAAITIAYAATAAGNSATIHVEELSSQVEELRAAKGNSGRGILDSLTAGRHISTRTTATGGIEVSQFWARDDAGALQKNLLQDDWEQVDLNQSAHLQIVGQEATGEAIDEAMIRAQGYSFDAGQNDALRAVSECQDEARLIIREGSEWANTRSVTGYGRIAPQPEDLVALVYTPTSGAPTHASSDHVITSITLAANRASVRATYVLRDYVSTV